jgi:hypothetical protein
MAKNLFLLALLTWVGLTHAHVAQESLAEAEVYKVEPSAPEATEAQRSVAGSKIKKQRKAAALMPVNPEAPADSSAIVEESEDSEVRYWQYSE